MLHIAFSQIPLCSQYSLSQFKELIAISLAHGPDTQVNVLSKNCTHIVPSHLVVFTLPLPTTLPENACSTAYLMPGVGLSPIDNHVNKLSSDGHQAGWSSIWIVIMQDGHQPHVNI